jgi:hypothetical protein
MEYREEILNELREISPLLARDHIVTPYRVPAGYFEALTPVLIDRVQDSELLPDYQLNMYKVPQGYFESLAANILEKVRYESSTNEVHAELETIAPLLNTIGRGNVYAIPAGYFDQLDPVPAKQEAKVVPFRKARRWMQYAAAAMISGILVTGAFLYTDTGNDLTGEKMDVPAELNKVSAGELSNYLDNPDASQVAVNDITADEKNNIKAVSDEELDQYLAEHADDLVNAATN